jgi:hypothetical protein
MASDGQKNPHGRRPRFLPLGQRVRLQDDPRGMIGVFAGIIIQTSSLALVIWPEELWTFEPLEASSWCPVCRDPASRRARARERPHG